MLFLSVFKDGTVKRFRGTDVVPPSRRRRFIQRRNPSPSIQYLRSSLPPNQKLPFLIYFHGGAFLDSSPFNSLFHNYVLTLVAKPNVLAVSFDHSLSITNQDPALILLNLDPAWDQTKKWSARL
ncbi:putative carboxylesterase 2 [Senna tora]|uniref:Putative carboxylesterase 2 n=1 Tax=Senna tora TaxID=362788 RepID=A0A834TWG3_9FABA|nr:putative carboxylesterase 2 [Senna tora]